MGAIFRRELGSFLHQASLMYFWQYFMPFPDFFFYSSTLYSASTDMTGLFSTFFTIIVFLIPVLTMKSFSEEKRQKTEQGLLTAPVSLGGIVLGKYFATLLVYIMGVSIIFIYALILSYFGDVAWNILFANYIALILLGGAFIAITMFVSALTENQVVAAVGGFLLLMVLQMFDVIASFIKIDFIANLFTSLSFYNKYNEFTYGIFNLSSVLFLYQRRCYFQFPDYQDF